MSTTEMASVEEILALAEARAATEIETWIPQKPNDRLSGIVIEVGSITTRFGIYATTTLEIVGPYVENGETKGEKGQLIRAAWMGAVLVASYQRMRPVPDDLVAFHHQKMVTPQSGMEDYPLIVAVVIDPKTGKSKIPVDLGIIVPSANDIENSNPRTDEIETTGADSIRATQAKGPLAPREDETPL